MRREATVGQLLTRAFAVLVGLILCSGLIEMAAVLTQHRAVRQLTEQVQPLQLANAHLRGVLTDAQRSLRGYSLTGDQAMLGGYAAARGNYAVTMYELSALTTARDAEVLRRQRAGADAWWALADRQSRAAPRSDDAIQGAARGKVSFQQFVDYSDAFDLELAGRARGLHRRSAVLQWVTVAAVGVFTVGAALIAAVTAMRTSRRITRPLGEVVTMLDRRGRGDGDVRIGVLDGPLEIQAVAEAVDAAADAAARVREQEENIARLRSAVRELGYRIRAELNVQDALDETVRGLAEIFTVDHVLIRMAAGPSDAPLLAGLRDEHLGDGPLAPLAGCGIDWLKNGDVWMTADPSPAGDVQPPDDERAAWASAGDGPVLIATVNSPDECVGAITMLREPGRPLFGPMDLGLAEVVAGDLGRAVHHARLFEREQGLVARLQALDNAKANFMSTVSHELRTPLTSISGYLELLLDAESGSLSDAQLRMLEVIGRNTRRLRELIEDILVLSKIETGTLRSELGAVDLTPVVEQAVIAIAPAAAKASVGLHLDIRGPLRIQGNDSQLDRVLNNLLSNAVKFTPADGTVTVRTERRGDNVVLTVADTGMGIPQEEQPALFARFFRATNAIHLAIPGTGLGLAIVHAIVANHGGGVEITSTLNVGTTVTVRLPADTARSADEP
jgi:two-component system, OmpR family, phosphate regulon sensor histidine kinase PhoR